MEDLVFANFSKTIALIILLALAVIAIFKVSIRFDLNAFLATRKAKHSLAAQHYCPHMEFQVDGDDIIQFSWFESPIGTSSWVCANCRLVKNNINEQRIRHDGEYYLNNPKAYITTRKKYNRHARKSS